MADFDPYHKWLGIPPRDQPPHHYRLLGIELYEGDPEVVEAATERHVTYLQSVATGPQVAESQRLLNEIAAARRCLLNPKQKELYDKGLRAKLAEAAQESDSNVKPPPVSSTAEKPPVVPPPKSATGDNGPKIDLHESETTPTTTKAGKPRKRRRSALLPLVFIATLFVVAITGGILFALGYFKPSAPTIAAVAKPQTVATGNAEKKAPQAIAAPSVTPPAAATPAAAKTGPKNLVAHYTFDEPATLLNDSVGEHHGVNHGAKQNVGANDDKSLEFDGKSACADIPLALTPDFTVAFWIKTGQVGGIAASWQGGLPVFMAPGELRGALVGNTLGISMKGNPTLVDSEIGINNNLWHHVAVVRRMMNKQYAIFVDGAQAVSRNGWTDAKTKQTSIMLGKSEIGDSHFEGLIDELMIYDYALSESEISDIYKAGYKVKVQPVPVKRGK